MMALRTAAKFALALLLIEKGKPESRRQRRRARRAGPGIERVVRDGYSDFLSWGADHPAEAADVIELLWDDLFPRGRSSQPQAYWW